MLVAVLLNMDIIMFCIALAIFHYYRIGLCSRPFVPVTSGGPTASRANVGDRGFLSRVEPPTRTKGPPFVPIGGSTRDKRVTLLSRLVVPTGTKGHFCPGWSHQP